MNRRKYLSRSRCASTQLHHHQVALRTCHWPPTPHRPSLAPPSLGGRNYVVQYLLELKDTLGTENVLDQLEGNFGYLSMQKYSINVVEKCLECAREDRRVRIILELIDDPQLLQILQDLYGNYVIQSAIKLCKVFAQLLQTPHDDANGIIKGRFPVPCLVICDQHGSQEKVLSILHLFANLNSYRTICQIFREVGSLDFPSFT